MPDIEFSIRVVDDDGEGVADVEVSIHYSLDDEQDTTDEDGWVTFDQSHEFQDVVYAKVYVDGVFMGEIAAEDGDTFSYTKP
jgi:hypothetical protein